MTGRFRFQFNLSDMLGAVFLAGTLASVYASFTGAMRPQTRASAFGFAAMVTGISFCAAMPLANRLRIKNFFARMWLLTTGHVLVALALWGFTKTPPSQAAESAGMTGCRAVAHAQEMYKLRDYNGDGVL